MTEMIVKSSRKNAIFIVHNINYKCVDHVC